MLVWSEDVPNMELRDGREATEGGGGSGLSSTRISVGSLLLMHLSYWGREERLKPGGDGRERCVSCKDTTRRVEKLLFRIC